MSNYTKSTNFATKDALASGNPLKIVKGTEIDTEFNNIATAVATKSDTEFVNTSIAALGNTFSFKNRIINGDMRIDQRNAGASVTPTDGENTLDRWKVTTTQSSKFSVQQNAGPVTPPNGFKSYLGCVSLSAYSVTASDAFLIYQNIEGFNVSDFGWGSAGAQAVTLSFWVRSSLTGTFSGALSNNALNRSYPFTYTISAANTWEQKTITVAGDTSGTWLSDNGIGLRVFLNLGSGSTYSGTAGAWAAADYRSVTGATSVVGTSGATFYITGVQLEKGSTATSFDYRPYGTELMLCQRYFCKTFQQATAVAQNTGSNLGAVTLPINITAGTVSSMWTDYIYPVVMRATPGIITTFNPSAANANWRNSAGTGDYTVTVANTSERAVQLRADNVAASQGAYIHVTASAEL